MKAALLLTASAMMLVCCGPRMTREQIVDCGETAYSDIVSYIVEGFQSHWEDACPQEMDLSSVYTYCSPYAGFAQTDIDGDGFDELLIGDQFEDGSYLLYDICCFSKKDGSLIHLASGGERDTFTVREGGVIVESGSSSACDSFVKGFKIEDDKLVGLEDEALESDVLPLKLERFSGLS